ncbi:hypothetical protein ACMGD3_11695 [Lysinibacillus sphaericus]|uniref:hypothetical protein n=1 Tax=Lysinibacillus sphaericus TaxID=1421 RepID=UPI003F793CBB
MPVFEPGVTFCINSSALKKHLVASEHELQKLTGINRKMIYTLIKEEGLKD